jgi:uncharacterized protein YydD (DUF2326 family)
MITDNEAVQLVDNYFTEEIKALRGDLIHKNTELLEEEKRRRMISSELDLLKQKYVSLKVMNSQLRSINAMKTNPISNPPI